MDIRYKYILTAALFIAAFTMRPAAQNRTVISGLEADSTYTALILREASLKSREDSLTSRIAEVRAMFRSDPDNRRRYSEDILKLEGEIFDTRNILGITAGRINTLEQQYIIRNLSQGGDPRQAGSGQATDEYPETSAVIVDNPFFSENLLPEDHAQLLEAQSAEEHVINMIEKFRENYSEISRIARELELTEEKEAADSLFGRYETLASLNGSYSEYVGRTFGNVYDIKLYCYNYILDKLGRRSQLQAFERKISETRDRAIAPSGSSQSPEIAAYPFRKALLLDYEKTFARIAGYELSLDSLSKAESTLSKMDFDFPVLGVEEKLFLDFADIDFHNPAKYNARNPVPAVTVHPKGEIYRILLGSFQKEQQVSVLRGAYPVGVIRRDGRYEYYAGGFPTLQEAEAAVAQLKTKGFKDPKIASWTDGTYKLYSQGEIDRLGRADTGLFRLSIDTGGTALPDVVKEILDDFDIPAEISRSGNLYIIGTFDSRDDAREVMEEILGETDGLDIKIEALG